MKLSKIFGLKNNRNFISLIKQKFLNKSFRNESNFLARKKLLSNNINTKTIAENKILLSKRNNKNIITINNIINNIKNNIIVKMNNPVEKHSKNKTLSNSNKKQSIKQLYRPCSRTNNTRINFFSFMKEYNQTSRNQTINNNISFNSLFNFNSYNNKIGKQPSFTNNKLKNQNWKRYKIYRRNKYINLTNNISSYNTSINNSINGSLIMNSKISLKKNNLGGTLRNKFYKAGKYKLKDRELDKKIKNSILRYNKNMNPLINLKNIKENIKKMRIMKKTESNKKNELNLNEYIHTKSNILSINKNKTLNNMIIRNMRYNNIYSNLNKTNININNNNRIYNYNKFNKKNKEKNSLYNIFFKDETNNQNIKVKERNIEIKNGAENNKKEVKLSINKQNKIEKIKNNDCRFNSFDNTIKLSKTTTKIEEEGELGLDEIKDLIIYFKLNKETNKDYLFKKNDYIDFIKNSKKRYVNFFTK